MQGFSINEVAAPPTTVPGQVIPPTGAGGWGADCQPGIDGTTPTADMLNDLLGNVLRVLQVAGIVPVANRYDDLPDAIQNLIMTAVAGGLTSLAAVAHSGSYNDLLDRPTIPAAQVNADWNAPGGVAQILNKPDMSQYATNARVDGDVINLQNNINGVHADLQNQVNGKQPAGNYLTYDVGFATVGSFCVGSNSAASSLGSTVSGLIAYGAAGNTALPGTWRTLALTNPYEAFGSNSIQLFLAQRIA
ncbi:hypothetical protein SAMN05445850_5581 [Paraburkholderia tuberum]|uniref:Uncharacterized protein n=2 Tax=Paraburkholderia tuberum TaxID=157910 RepID=A0A1H1JSF7_9BURK|nr:hypothetical protein SAMN05445850_5581 [Paraburkholderia tuberum]